MLTKQRMLFFDKKSERVEECKKWYIYYKPLEIVDHFTKDCER